MAPSRLDIVQRGNVLEVRTTRIVEYADDQVTDETMPLDGTQTKSEFMNSPRVSSAKISGSGDAITVNSVVTFSWGAPGAKMTSSETWKLEDGGDTLVVRRHTSSPRGEQDVTLVFDRR
jgi:hypothetical protein